MWANETASGAQWCELTRTSTMRYSNSAAGRGGFNLSARRINLHLTATLAQGTEEGLPVLVLIEDLRLWLSRA